MPRPGTGWSHLTTVPPQRRRGGSGAAAAAPLKDPEPLPGIRTPPVRKQIPEITDFTAPLPKTSTGSPHARTASQPNGRRGGAARPSPNQRPPLKLCPAGDWLGLSHWLPARARARGKFGRVSGGGSGGPAHARPRPPCRGGGVGGARPGRAAGARDGARGGGGGGLKFLAVGPRSLSLLSGKWRGGGRHGTGPSPRSWPRREG